VDALVKTLIFANSVPTDDANRIKQE